MASLISKTNTLCKKLSQNGWREMLLAVTNNQLDIKQKSEEELLLQLKNSLTKIDRTFPGFEDFSNSKSAGITLRNPSCSLLYHALASSSVKYQDKNKTKKLGYFPTLEEIELIENFVFGFEPTKFEKIKEESNGKKLAIVVYANQYRTFVDTPGEKHADIVFSRTGVSRVGTAQMNYDNESRSFSALVDDDDYKIRVLPAKYNAYLAVEVEGDRNFLGLGFMRGDSNRKFWKPVHKLFDGKECIDGMNLKLEFNCFHVNEKNKKTHDYIFGKNNSHNKEPFVFSEGIANFDENLSLVIPLHHKSLVEEIKTNNDYFKIKKLALDNFERDENEYYKKVPGGKLIPYSSSLNLEADENEFGDFRSAPEYLHVRTKIKNGKKEDMNQKPELMKAILEEEYDAVHYRDYAGDGYVSVKVNGELSEKIKINLSAYSLVSAPDFFPFCEQNEIFDLTMKEKEIWRTPGQKTPPETLADTRFPANINSHDAFKNQPKNSSDTITALIQFSKYNKDDKGPKRVEPERKISYLTDGAAGIFAPGWDTSTDLTGNIIHLSSYGLGSPFPEDAKLCAALSSFWPAVAPDISRSFWRTAQLNTTVLPMTDEEIGANSKAPGWDGEFGPQYNRKQNLVTYKRFEYVDYTLNALHNKFNFRILSQIDANDYLKRVRMYYKLRMNDAGVKKDEIKLVSYTVVNESDEDYANEKSKLGDYITGKAHKFIFIRPAERGYKGVDEIEIEVEEETIYLVSDENGKMAKKSGSENWKRVN